MNGRFFKGLVTFCLLTVVTFGSETVFAVGSPGNPFDIGELASTPTPTPTPVPTFSPASSAGGSSSLAGGVGVATASGGNGTTGGAGAVSALSGIDLPNVRLLGTGAEFEQVLNLERDYLLIVNEQKKFLRDSDYARSLEADLVFVVNAYGAVVQVEQATLVAFLGLQRALEARGIRIEIAKAYQPDDPESSEYLSGLLISFVVLGQDGTWTKVYGVEQKSDPKFSAIYDLLPEYGFIERYPAGKEEFTGVSGNPSEIRFIGSAVIAEAITSGEMCLEEYVLKG